MYLSILAFGSAAWLSSAVRVAFPSFLTFLLALLTLPSSIRAA
jgi:hypothetical protein